MADDLVERLAAVQRRFPVALDLGAYHGLVGRRLRQVPGVEMVVDAEPSARLLAQCEAPRVQAGEEALPFRDQSLDLVVSGLSLHLVNDLPGALVQVRRALKPDGLFLAALLGGSTLSELRTALLAAEEELEGGASPRVAPFADVRDLGALLQRAALRAAGRRRRHGHGHLCRSAGADARGAGHGGRQRACAPAAGRRCAAPP